eukprot:TRINITY_DN7331_c0_g1_i1.p1 TRINITY_DN7331_c0_g1~~TRINITY_DN7331_c0_g1_i1.p1  ORF type:complete len:356 (+),score=67.97 TRINITY_DN7331_c0_g1_i1:48-1115(+)
MSLHSLRGWMLSRLSNRGLIHFQGSTVETLLHGIVSNEVRKMRPDAVIHTGAFHSQGRLLYDLNVYNAQRLFAPEEKTGDSSSSNYFLDCEKSQISQVMAHFRKFDIRKKVSITDVSEQFSVWQTCSSSMGDEKMPSLIQSPSIISSDPRSSLLGNRIIANNKNVSIDGFTSVPETYYDLLRTAHGIAEGQSELGNGKLVPLEANLDYLNAISWTKGCYQGQELSARTHYRGVVRKRILPVRLIPTVSPIEYASLFAETQKQYSEAISNKTAFPQFVDANANYGSLISSSVDIFPSQNATDAKKDSVATLLVHRANIGLAMVYMDHVGSPMYLPEANLSVVPYYPAWWPSKTHGS